MDLPSLTLPICLIVGGSLTASAIYSALGSERLTKRGRLSNGVITALIRGQSSSGDMMPCYYPEFRFDDQDGTTHSVQSSEGTSPPAFRVGQRVRVLYDPAQPSFAKIDTFGQMWLLPILFGVLGPALLVAALVLWLKGGS